MFSCYVCVQNKLSQHEEQFKMIATNLSFQTILNNIIGILFKICMQKMSQEEQVKILSTKNQENFQNVKFAFFDGVEMDSLINESDVKMTQETQASFQEFIDWEKKMENIRDQYESGQAKKNPQKNSNINKNKVNNQRKSTS